MSWLGTLAAKTENLLNKVDQAAGQALQNNEAIEKYDNSSPTEEPIRHTLPHLSEPKRTLNTLSSDFTIPKRINSSSRLSKMDSKKDLDSELIEYLNDTQSGSVTKKNITLPNPQNTTSTGSVNTNKKPDATTESKKEEIQIKEEEASKVADDSTASIMMENQLLKDEIQSLNQELMSIAFKGKSTQEEHNKTLGRLETEQRQLHQKEAMVRELREREADLINAVQAKDAQLSVLRVRLEESDVEIEMKKKTIEEFQSEKKNILEDHSLSTGVQSQALDNLQERLKEMESNLKNEQDRNKQLEGDMRGAMRRLEQDKESHSAEMADLQKKLSSEKVKSIDINNQLKLAKSQAQQAKQEFLQYKEKATRILQSKEKLIGKLKETSATPDASGASEPAMTEVETLRQEKDLLREELCSIQLSLEGLKAEYADLEMQLEQDQSSSKDQLSQMEEHLKAERRRKEDADNELTRKTQELKYLQEEMITQKAAFQGRLAEREADIQKLRNQLTTKSLSSSSSEELEGRLHALTESLIQKQTCLETLSSEKNSLLLQLERVEKQYREAENSALRQSSTSLNMSNDDDDVRARFTTFMRESPFDSRVTRNVKKAANSIDKFSIRLGVFLRRYPIARVFVIIYMFLLHIWVMVVLLTYKPEVHNLDYTSGFPHAP